MKRISALWQYAAYITLFQATLAYATCSNELMSEGKVEPRDTTQIAQWLLFDASLANRHNNVYARLMRETARVKLNPSELFRLTELVPYLDVQYMLFKSQNTEIPSYLLSKSREVLKKALAISKEQKDLLSLQKALEGEGLSWDANSGWKGSKLRVVDQRYNLLGALWILTDAGDCQRDLLLAEQIVELLKTISTDSDYTMINGFQTMQQHASVKAQRRLAERFGGHPLPLETSILFSKFLFPRLRPSNTDAATYEELFTRNVKGSSPFTYQDRFRNGDISRYLEYVNGLENRSFYIQRLNALQVLEEGKEADHWHSLVRSLRRDTVGWLFPSDYRDLLLVARKMRSAMGETVVATYLAIRHFHGEQIVDPADFPELVHSARTRIQRYLQSGIAESDLLEEPLVLSVFGESSDAILVDKYLKQSKGAFQRFFFAKIKAGLMNENL